MSAVLAALSAYARLKPRAPALASGVRIISYVHLERAVEEAATRLAQLIARAPGPVAFQLDNGFAWVILDLALMRLKCAALPLPTFFSYAQTVAALKDSGAAWMIVDHGEGNAFMLADDIVFVRPLFGEAQMLPAGTAKISYTSGSTGTAKGVCLAQSHMDRVAQSIVMRFGAKFAVVHAPVLPLGVLLENVAGLYAVLIAGGLYRVEAPETLGCADPFKPDFARMAVRLKDIGATSLILVPELLRGLLAARAFGAFDPSRLRLIAVGGAKVSPDLVNSARAAGLPVFEGYGLTECASVVAVNAPGADKIGCVGKPLDHSALRIAEDAEIVIGGENYLGFTGCKDAPCEVRTGDVGYLDDQGFLYVEGRKSNVIITSYGRNVSPEWVESELMAEPLIRHAIVLGEGEAALRALVAPLSPSVDVDALAACIERVNARLPAYARVASFRRFVPDTARHFTSNGKLRRADILASELSFARGAA